MAKVFSAQEMREIAKSLKDSGLCLKISDMLRQAADVLEGKEKREKNYQYGVKTYKYNPLVDYIGYSRKRAESIIRAVGKPLAKLVRRPVGEWEEVKDEVQDS